MVVVFGSINLDLVTRVPRMPSPGETLIGSGFASYPGGKGANQALAAARAGAVVRMYGAVGRDAAAASALALLRAGGVDVAGVRAVDAPTGCRDHTGRRRAAKMRSWSCPAPMKTSIRTRSPTPSWRRAPCCCCNTKFRRRPTPHWSRARRGAGTRIVLNAAPARPLTASCWR